MKAKAKTILELFKGRGNTYIVIVTIFKDYLIVTVIFLKNYLIVTVIFSGLGFDLIWCLNYERFGRIPRRSVNRILL